MRATFVVIVVMLMMAATSLVACKLSSEQELADAGIDEDGASASPDAQTASNPDADISIDASPDQCHAESLLFLAGNRPLATGDYCDDIQLCVDSAEAAESIMAIMPAFVCSDTGCSDGQFACQWFNPDYIEAEEYAQLCELTLVENGPETVRCNLYL